MFCQLNEKNFIFQCVSNTKEKKKLNNCSSVRVYLIEKWEFGKIRLYRREERVQNGFTSPSLPFIDILIPSFVAFIKDFVCVVNCLHGWTKLRAWKPSRPKSLPRYFLNLKLFCSHLFFSFLKEVFLSSFRICKKKRIINGHNWWPYTHMCVCVCVHLYVSMLVSQWWRNFFDFFRYLFDVYLMPF